MKQMLSRAATILIWLSLIYACYELGIWQLHRAQALNVATAPKPDQPLIELNKVASPGMNMPIKAVNRIVSADGSYATSYLARDQQLSEGEVGNFDVRLLKLKTGHAVLVVREVFNQEFDRIDQPVSITGRLYPRQNVDRAFAKPGELSRIDPALVVSKEYPFLYDGYIILQSEKQSNAKLSDLTLIPTPQISQRLPGFYWQHISYVVVWWFMGLLLLIAPAFPQFRSPKAVKKSRGKIGSK
ncbi:MAG: SURF1 family cytochrome oxidase biogenesis protein [Candidatus Nanopelagicus sp.]